ncbi:protein IMPACT isoform X3 [Astyanax mexicanus]|uniref:protein IMPACT isoform X3 n=1 Tax=Astyanax mexicanus TaxID=7994 RepID=UPI0020CB3C02|nr:protein IMPACT isoform X3 [Astyanax mexicanus]
MDTGVENSSDLQSQVEEIEALSSIYGDEWCVIDEASRIFCIKISDDIYEPRWSVCLQIILPEDYPSSAPPIYQINAGWLRGPDRVKICNSLEELYLENVGESILYLWVEKIREFLIERLQRADAAEEPETGRAVATEEEDEDWGDVPDYSALKLNTEQVHLFSSSPADEELPPIKHGEAVTDRRSNFQPHLAPVVTPKQILDVRNVLVVVSRWYGGILLGPDRFKHINNCARNILVQEGYTETMDEASKPVGKSRKPKNKKMK